MLTTIPMMIVIAVAISLTSKGGPIFIHLRAGKDRSNFRLFKFRTMAAGTHEKVLNDENLRLLYEANDFKLPENTAFVTPVGRFLRKLSLDELPQLWNVVRGDMSLVGIRPIVAEQVAERGPLDQALYYSARPGLTGLWQVAGRSTVVDDDRVALDRDYIESWSLTADLKILARTPRAVFRTELTG